MINCDGCKKEIKGRYYLMEILVNDEKHHDMGMCKECKDEALDVIRLSLVSHFKKKTKEVNE
jgi:hypothetical protein